MNEPLPVNIGDWDTSGIGFLLDDLEPVSGIMNSSSALENESLNIAIKLLSDPESMKYGVLFTTFDRKIKFANKAIAQIFGNTVDNLVGQNLDWILIDNETRLRLPPSVAFPGGSHIVRVKTRNGSFCLILYRFQSTDTLINLFMRTVPDAEALFTASARFSPEFLSLAQVALAHNPPPTEAISGSKDLIKAIRTASSGSNNTVESSVTAPTNKKIRNVVDPSIVSVHPPQAPPSASSTLTASTVQSDHVSVSTAKSEAVAELMQNVQLSFADDNGDNDSLDSGRRKTHTLDPNKRRGRWTYEEDSKLLDLIKIYVDGETNWAEIADKMEGRTKKQCKSRWEEHLCPVVNKEPFSAEEDKLLEYYQSQPATRNKWKAIAAKLSGRTGNTVKARWISIERKRNKKRKPRGADENSDDDFLDDLAMYAMRHEDF